MQSMSVSFVARMTCAIALADPLPRTGYVAVEVKRLVGAAMLCGQIRIPWGHA
jgi:hypothetical protein